MSIYSRLRLLNHVRKHATNDPVAEQMVRVLSYMTKFSLRGLLKSLLGGRPSYTLMRYPDGTVSLEVIRNVGVDYKVAVDMYWAPHPVIEYVYMLDRPELAELFRRSEVPVKLLAFAYMGESMAKGISAALRDSRDLRAVQEIQEFASGTDFLEFCRGIEACAGTIRLSYYFGEYEDGSLEAHIVAHDYPGFHRWVRIIGNSLDRPGFPNLGAGTEAETRGLPNPTA